MLVESGSWRPLWIKPIAMSTQRQTQQSNMDTWRGTYCKESGWNAREKVRSEQQCKKKEKRNGIELWGEESWNQEGEEVSSGKDVGRAKRHE